MCAGACPAEPPSGADGPQRRLFGGARRCRLWAAAHRKRSGAPFNGARDGSCREPYVDNGMRTMPRASMVGNQWGLKPVKQRAASTSHTRGTARVLRPLRTQGTAVGSVVNRAGGHVAATPQSHKGLAEGLARPHVGRRCLRSARRRGGRDGLLASLALALGHSHTASPPW